jgi:AraC family transcriptional activator of pobA
MPGHLKWELEITLVEAQLSPEGIHMWPFSQSLPIDIRFFDLDRPRNLPLHRPDHCELILIDQGEVLYETENREYRLHKGDLIVVGSKVLHRCRKIDGPVIPAKAIVLLFLPEPVADTHTWGGTLNLLTPFSLAEYGFTPVIPGSTGIPRKVRCLVNQMHSLLPVTSADSIAGIKIYLHLILFLLARYSAGLPELQERVHRDSQMLERLRPLLNFLEAHYQEDISLTQAARLVSISPSHFIHCFKLVTGISFINYLNQLRIAKSQSFLVETCSSVSDVGQQVGFSSHSYFTSLFRRYAKMTPTQYRSAATGQVLSHKD